MADVIETPSTAEAQSYAEHKALRTPKAPDPASGTEEQPHRDDTGKFVAPEKKPSEPAKPGESAAASEAQTQETQEGTTQEEKPKRDRSAEGRAKELIAAGRTDEALKILRDAAAKTEKERADSLEKELQTLRTRKPAESTPATEPPKAKAPAATATSGEDPAPKEADYDGSDGKTYEDYLVDKARWKIRQEDRASAQQTHREQTARTVQTKLTAAKAKYADFDSVTTADLAAGTGLILSPAMQQFVVESDSGMDVVYHLGSTPADYQRIFALSPARQLAELGKLEDKLGTQAAPPPEKPKPPVSKAPPPPRRTSGGEPPPAKSTAEAGSMAEHRRLRRREG